MDKEGMLSANRRLAQVSLHLRRYMTLESASKTSSFTERLKPDPKVPTVEFAQDPASPPELFHRARLLKGGAFTWTRPERRKSYEYLTSSPNALKDLGLDPSETGSDYYRKLVSGQEIVKAPYPYAQAYAGYQFRDFAGQLGDGRVVNLFEITNPAGERYELQLKGAGKTPFSRFADGKAVLRSSVREFIVSESLNAIGIPSTRALAITGLPKTYAQRSGAEKCAVVCRMAPTWVRIGTFDLYKFRGDRQGLIELSDYVIDEVFKGELLTHDDKLIFAEKRVQELGELTKFDQLFYEIIARNAKSVAYWQAYCFLNGVLNTDNTSVMGLAMDFGPFAFMDYFQPDYTSNHDDHTAMYSFRNMPSAIWFNLVKLSEDMAELLGAGPDLVKTKFFLEKGITEEQVDPVTKRAKQVIDAGGDIYERIYIDTYMRLVCRRLGITPRPTDAGEVLAVMFECLQYTKLDYNQFFVTLQEQPINDDSKWDIDVVASKFIPDNFTDDPFTDYTRENVVKMLKSFLTLFKQRVESEQLTDALRYERAKGSNPLFVPRNWVLDEVIDYTQDNDMDPLYLNKLLKMVSNPYDKSQWGEELNEVEKRWYEPTVKENQMGQCSCSS